MIVAAKATPTTPGSKATDARASTRTRFAGACPSHSRSSTLSVAIDDELGRGACIGIFPEATRSLGQVLRAKSGVGRLAAAVPDATVVLVRTNGTTDVVRWPKRPSVTVEFLLPSGGQLQLGESAIAFSKRLLIELRDGAPVEVPGRKRTEAKFRAQIDAK